MKKDVLTHMIDFITLGIILGLCLSGLYLFRGQVDKQLAVTVLLGLSYVMWGIFHHLRLGNLKFQLVLEYISVSALVVFILTLFLLRV